MKYQNGFVTPLLLLIITIFLVGGGAYMYKGKQAEVPTVTSPTSEIDDVQKNELVGTEVQQGKSAPLSTIIPEYKGDYPSKTGLFSNEEVSRRLKLLLGANYEVVTKNFQVETPLEIVPESVDVYKTVGFPAHAGGAYDISIYFDVSGNNINVVTNQYGSIKTYAEKGVIDISEIRKLDTATAEVIDKTPNWKTYTNTQYGFSFQYPDTLVERNMQFLPQNDQGGTAQVRIVEESLDKNSVEGFYGITEQSRLTEVSVAGKAAYYFNEGDAGCGGPDYRVPLDANHHLSIRFVDCESQTPYIQSFINQILSTFQFTASNLNTSDSVIVTYPNGGEVLSWGNIIMAGDLYFSWTTSLGSGYVPSEKKKAYIVDVDGNIVRDDPMFFKDWNLSKNGEFKTYFVDSKNLQYTGKYKIMVCDYLNNINEYCDSSDGYFTFE